MLRHHHWGAMAFGAAMYLPRDRMVEVGWPNWGTVTVLETVYAVTGAVRRTEPRLDGHLRAVFGMDEPAAATGRQGTSPCPTSGVTNLAGRTAGCTAMGEALALYMV